MACPICASPEGSAITDGMRAGAAVLIVTSTLVLGAIARAAIRMWMQERAAESVKGVDA